LEIIREVEPDAKKQIQQQGRIQPNAIEQWLFNGKANFSTARKKLEEKLDAKIAVVSRMCELTEQQQTHLHLAGTGDIHRFLRDCEALRSTFDELDQGQMNEIWQLVQPLRNRFNYSLFGKDSLFERVQKNALKKEQIQILERRRRESLEYAVVTGIYQVVAQLDNVSPLKPQDRKDLVKLLAEEVPLPDSLQTSQQRQLVQHYILYSCNNIPAEKMKAVVGDTSWEVLNKSIRNVNGFGNHLKAIGMIKE